jgi:hypothetical protein
MEMLREAGWPVYFVIPLGLASLGAAAKFAIVPRRGDGALVIGLGLATIIAGMLATVFGMQLALGAMGNWPEPAHDGWRSFIGVKEALCDFDVALIFALATALVGMFGFRRGAAAAEPRAAAGVA